MKKISSALEVVMRSGLGGFDGAGLLSAPDFEFEQN